MIDLQPYEDEYVIEAKQFTSEGCCQYEVAGKQIRGETSFSWMTCTPNGGLHGIFHDMLPNSNKPAYTHFQKMGKHEVKTPSMMYAEKISSQLTENQVKNGFFPSPQ